MIDISTVPVGIFFILLGLLCAMSAEAIRKTGNKPLSRNGFLVGACFITFGYYLVVRR